MENVLLAFRLTGRFLLFLFVTLFPFAVTGILAYYSVIYETALYISIAIASVLLIYSTITILLYKRKNEKAALFWIIFVTVLPIFGPLSYMMYGSHYIMYDNSLNRKEKEREELFKSKEEYMIRKSSFTNYKIYENGLDKYNDLIDDLMKAKKEILIQYFIIRNDYIFSTVVNVLKKKSEEGVDIKFSVDYVGSWNFDLHKLKKLESLGIEVNIFNKISPSVSQGSMNHRNHRKSVIIDDNVLYSGGMNLAKYYGGMSSRFGIWADLHFKFSGGDIAKEYKRTFLLDWKHSYDRKTEIKELKSPKASNIKVFDDGPDIKSAVFLKYLIKQINESKKEISISMPYPIYPSSLEKALFDAKKRGVKITVVSPGMADKLSAYICSYYYLKRLNYEGIEVRRFNNIFLHSKLIIIDNVAISGTSNTDYRSFYQHYETNFVSDDPKLTNDLKKVMKTYTDNSSLINYRFRKIIFVDKIIYYILKIPSPVL